MKEAVLNQREALGKITEIKRILSVVQSSSDATQHACYVITSGEQGEGKTTLCAGLAISAAEQNGCRVLAVDYNWHTPSLHEFFDIDPFNDAEELNNGKSLEQLVHHTDWDNLDVLPAAKETNGNSGSVDAGWYLDLLNTSREMYDYVFVDTASIYPTNYKMMDPVLISKEANGVVLVALTNVTPRQTLKRAAMTMKTSGASLIGVVANQWQNPIM